MALLKTPAIILKSRRWGEADRIVICYSLRFGKIRAVARGARKLKSRFGAALEPFSRVDLNLFEKPGDSLYRLTQADIREAFPRLAEDLSRMAGAARLVNLVSAVTVEADPEPRIFDTLLEGLRAFQNSNDAALTALLFQIRLLGQTGFRPQTEHCALCGREERASAAAFSARSGGLLCGTCAVRADRTSGRCSTLSPGSWAFLRQAARMPPSVLTRLKATEQVRKEVEAALESFVRVVAGTRLPPVDFLASDHQEPAYGPTI